MSEPKGPRVELPDDLAEELEQNAQAEVDVDLDAEADDCDAEAAPEAPAGESPEVDEETASELEALRDKHLRLAAEFENYKRRTLKERQDLHNYATENLIKQLLVTVDNLERALGHVRASDRGEEGIDAKALLDGVELTFRSLVQTLERSGVKVVEAEGEGFDPQVHEAVMQVPSKEHEPGRVVDVHQKGYLLKDRLLRPALVAVSSRPPDEDDG